MTVMFCNKCGAATNRPTCSWCQKRIDYANKIKKKTCSGCGWLSSYLRYNEADGKSYCGDCIRTAPKGVPLEFVKTILKLIGKERGKCCTK